MSHTATANVGITDVSQATRSSVSGSVVVGLPSRSVGLTVDQTLTGSASITSNGHFHLELLDFSVSSETDATTTDFSVDWEGNAINQFASIKSITFIADGEFEIGLQGSYTQGTAATATTSLTGSNNDLVFTSEIGAAGNDINVIYSPWTSLSTSVDGTAITVKLPIYPTQFVVTGTLSPDLTGTYAFKKVDENTALPIWTTGTVDYDFATDTFTGTGKIIWSDSTFYAISTVSSGTRDENGFYVEGSTIPSASTTWISENSATGTPVTTPSAVTLATATQVKSAIEANDDASALIGVGYTSGNTGEGTISISSIQVFSLSGGANSSGRFIHLGEYAGKTQYAHFIFPDGTNSKSLFHPSNTLVIKSCSPLTSTIKVIASGTV